MLHCGTEPRNTLHALWLITVPNMNKINPFFSEICKHIKLKKNIAIITQIWLSQLQCYMHQQHIVPIPNVNKINLFFSAISQIHKKYEKMVIITQICTEPHAILQT